MSCSMLESHLEEFNTGKPVDESLKSALTRMVPVVERS